MADVVKAHTYKLKYEVKVTPGEFSGDEIKKEGLGGTDALVMFSVLYPEDGTYSALHTSWDGRNEGKEINGRELFKIWMLLGKNLSQRGDIDDVRKELAAMPSDMFFKLVSEKKT